MSAMQTHDVPVLLEGAISGSQLGESISGGDFMNGGVL